MSRIYPILTNTFVAVDKDGNEYQMEVWTTIVESVVDGQIQRRQGIKELLANGQSANFIEKGKYQTLFGVDLSSNDPNCL